MKSWDIAKRCACTKMEGKCFLSQTDVVGATEIDKIKKNETSWRKSVELYHPFPTIPEVFSEKSVLVTGATGFLGKVLVEKLLRSCPGIKEVFILIRPSKKGTVEDRLKEYRQHRVFNRLKDESPGALNKLRALTGDVALDNAGLSGGDLRIVITEVSFVFHCAANVRFDDDARQTLSTNLVGVQNILDVCKSCQKLQALVHVSTAFSFCNHEIISEQIYPETVRPQHVLETAKWMTNNELLTLCMHYIQGRPSLYHFSKALAETLLVETKHDVPVIIVRPSIVTASVAEPFPGWIDNYNGPSGFISVCGKGIVRTLLVDPKVNADWVPVDTVANTLIAAAHYVVLQRNRQNPMVLRATNRIPIINCTCPHQNTVTWSEVIQLCLPLLIKYPSMEVYSKPGGTVTSSKVLYFICRLTYHYLPALLVDSISCVLLKKPRMIYLYNRIHGVMSHLEYYTTRSFIFNTQNMYRLINYMDPEDRKVFPMDQGVLDWDKYMENYVLGVRRYFSQESDDTLPEARKRMRRLYYFWMTMKFSSMFGVFMFVKFLYQRSALKIPLTSLLPFHVNH